MSRSARMLAFWLAACAQFVTAQQRSQNALKEVQVNGVTLHYSDQGTGPAVVFVHGGMEDYRAWDAQIVPFATKYRVIAYSRRYNYPNQNVDLAPDYSAMTDAEDLAALIRKLNVGPARIVGHSYGAYTALFLAAKHPELVSSMVLSEPPMLTWLNDIPGGQPLLRDFMDNLWTPAGKAFQRHDTEGALRVTVEWFGSHEDSSTPSPGKPTFATLPPEMRAYFLQNAREWEALTTSRNAFPHLQRERVAGIHKPVLLLKGGQSVELLKTIATELAHTLPRAEFVTFPKATHEMWSEIPEECSRKALQFFAAH